MKKRRCSDDQLVVRRLTVHLHPGRDPEVMLFRCSGCKHLVCGWCQGAADEHPDLCDACWTKVTPSPGTVDRLAVKKRRAEKNLAPLSGGITP